MPQGNGNTHIGHDNINQAAQHRDQRHGGNHLRNGGPHQRGGNH